jgi:hypothetical protein
MQSNSGRGKMIATHIHDALSQVRKLQELILEKRTFRGYSGKARMVGSVLAIAGSVIMSAPFFPADALWHLAGWAGVLILALVLNYGALFIWFMFNPEVKRNAAMLVPAIDALPGLAMGALLSVVCFMKGYDDIVFGIWMCCYGLAHVSYRNTLPQTNYAVGLFYMLSGAVCLFWPGITFTNPWPMGIVFGIGEMCGGYILHRNNKCQNDPMERGCGLFQ